MKHAILLLCCAGTLCHGQGSLQTVTITFEGPPVVSPGPYTLEREYFESGVWFRSDPPQLQFERWNGGPPPDNNTTYLRKHATLLFSLLDGAGFDLVSVDLAELSIETGNPARIGFIGYRQDGTSVATDFTTDGVIDGAGGLSDFETFSFGPEFSDLVLVEIPGFPFTGGSLDNFVIVIPEPAAGALLMSGGIVVVGLVGTRRRIL